MIRVPAFTCLQWGIFLVGGCLFFELNYRYWYMFMEQYSIFLYAGEYFRDLSVQPGGMSQYLSAFVMQCFHLPFAAPVCVTLLLGLMTSAMLFIVRRSSLASSPYARLLCFVPAFLFFVYPVESVAPVTAAVLGLSATAAYSCIGNRWIRAAAGFAFVTILYPLAAPAHFVAAAGMLAYECIPACGAKAEFGLRRILLALAIVAWAALLPLLAMRTVYVAPMREIFIGKHLFHPEYPLPASFWYIALSFPAVWTALVIMSRKRAAAPAKSSKQRLITLAVMAVAALLAIIYGGHPLEQAYMYDSLAREGRWEAIAAHASTH
ncbi:MAG: DUF6057 family protein, partial [Tannerellaceae bacterium]|nr:DUF6057 family protein [Tannerellaceae bacterium]